jgi:hypothetical protein
MAPYEQPPVADTVPDFPHVKEGDTSKVIDGYKNIALRRICTLLSAFMLGRFTYNQFLLELTDEDINFINKNAVSGFRELGGIGIEMPTPTFGSPTGITLSQGDVKLTLKREDIEKRLSATISEQTHNAVRNTMAEGKSGYTELLQHLKDNFSQTVVHATSKNAYEIRESIIKEAIKLSKGGDVDDVLEIAEQLYRFVEGPNKRK